MSVPVAIDTGYADTVSRAHLDEHWRHYPRSVRRTAVHADEAGACAVVEDWCFSEGARIVFWPSSDPKRLRMRLLPAVRP